MDLYQYNLYEQSLSDYDKAYPILKNNGEFLINYGKALSIAGKHAEAIKILEQAKSHQSNSVLHTAMGDSHKAIRNYDDAEENYRYASYMAPGKFYPYYLLAKLYEETGQRVKALETAKYLLDKDVKVPSPAIEEIREEMKRIVDQYTSEQTIISNNSRMYYRQKGRDNQYASLEYSMVPLPDASFCKIFSFKRELTGKEV